MSFFFHYLAWPKGGTMSVLNSVIHGFAFIGTLWAGNWIFSKSWKTSSKVIACLILLGLVGGIFSPNVPIVGLFNPIAALLASMGIALSAEFLYKKFSKKPSKKSTTPDRSWIYKTVVVFVTLGLLMVIWLPVFLNPIGALPRVPIGGFDPSTFVPTNPSSTHASARAPRATHQREQPLESCENMLRSIRKNVPRCNP